MAIFAGTVGTGRASGGGSARAEGGGVRPPLGRTTRRRRAEGSSVARRGVARRGKVGAVDCGGRDRDEWAWLLAVAAFTVLMVVLLALFGAGGDVRLEGWGAVHARGGVDDSLWGVLGAAGGAPASSGSGGFRGAVLM